MRGFSAGMKINMTCSERQAHTPSKASELMTGSKDKKKEALSF
jgi:hypothetical protein